MQVSNIFNEDRIAQYTSMSKDDVIEMLEEMRREQLRWMQYTQNDREQQIKQYS